MRSLTELGGRDLHWQFDGSLAPAETGQRHYLLWHATEPVLSAQVSWQKHHSFDLALEALEDTYLVSLDWRVPFSPAFVRASGQTTPLATLRLLSGPSREGIITTAADRSLFLSPTSDLTPSSYRLLTAAGAVLLTLAPALLPSTPALMSVAPWLAADPDLNALVTLVFAHTQAQSLLSPTIPFSAIRLDSIPSFLDPLPDHGVIDAEQSAADEDGDIIEDVLTRP
jgi:hypothetical protein